VFVVWLLSITPEGDAMNDVKRGIVWVAILTICILLLPLVAMQFTNEVNWNKSDFIAMGLLCFSMGSLYILVSNVVPQRKLLIGIVFLIIFVSIWAELAVGIFTNTIS